MPDIAVATLATPSRSRPERLLRKKEVCERLGGIDPATLYRWIEKGWFPKPVRMTPEGRIDTWHESKVDAFIASRVQGGGNRPDVALAELRRRRQNGKAGKTVKVKMVKVKMVRNAP